MGAGSAPRLVCVRGQSQAPRLPALSCGVLRAASLVPPAAPLPGLPYDFRLESRPALHPALAAVSSRFTSSLLHRLTTPGEVRARLPPPAPSGGRGLLRPQEERRGPGHWPAAALPPVQQFSNSSVLCAFEAGCLLAARLRADLCCCFRVQLFPDMAAALQEMQSATNWEEAKASGRIDPAPVSSGTGLAPGSCATVHAAHAPPCPAQGVCAMRHGRPAGGACQAAAMEPRPAVQPPLPCRAWMTRTTTPSRPSSRLSVTCRHTCW